MRIVSKISVSLFALALMIGFSAKGLAADATTGSIKGTVTGADGKPAAKVSVKLYEAGVGRKPGAKGASTLADAPAPDKKKPARTAIKEATTDDKGEFTMTDVPVGDYTVSVGARGDATGTGRATVTVKAGEAATATITLKVRKPKGQ